MTSLRNLTFFALSGVLAAGCADTHGAHLIGKLSYEQADADVAKAVPADADPQVGKCAGSSSLLDSNGRGIKKSAEITPPYFVGLWPAAKRGAPEIHGRIDLPSVGRPLPGDQPFLKVVVCTLEAEGLDKSFDWKLEEQLDGEYYVGAWFDRDMNGYPGVDEPLGFYREGTTGPAVKVTFKKSGAQRTDIAIGAITGDPAAQADALLANLELALQNQDQELFSSQFQPLYFKDPFNRTINQIDELYESLVTDTNPLSTKAAWLNDTKPTLSRGVASGAGLVISQTKAPDPSNFDPSVDREVNIVLGAGRDGIVQIMDWQPSVELSGDFTVTNKPGSDFAGDGDLEYDITIPAAEKWWIGVEKFVPATDAPSGGTWTTIASSATFTTYPAGRLLFTVSPGTGGDFVLVDLDPETMIRVTFIPVGGENGYPYWSPLTQAIEPTRGNYLRFYHVGANYIYRKPLPKTQ